MLAKKIKGSVSAAPVETDADFKQTVLLLHGDGTNGAQNNTFTDSSTNAFTITRNGNTTQGTFSPFSQAAGYWGNYFDGTGDYLSGTMSSDLAFGTSDMSMQCWVYPTTLGSTNTIFDTRQGGTSFGNDSFTLSVVSGIVSVAAGSYSTSVYVIESPSSISANTWTHIAFSRVSGTNYLFINGSQVASNSNSWNQTYTAGRSFYIGQTIGFSREFAGYISNLKAVNGTGFTSVTVPTTPLTATTNTKLLTCQSNRFIDNSTNAFAITVNGDTSVQAFSPFAPTAAYSAGTNGGSGYFDGTDDCLDVATTTLNPRTDSFTTEGWFYVTSTSGSRTLVGSTSNSLFYISYLPGTTLLAVGDGTTNTIEVTVSALPYSWNYFAISFDGTTYRAYINGTRVQESTTLLASNSVNLTVGARNSGSFRMLGYLSDVRHVKGSALYTGSTMTVPTAPLSTVSGTEFLLKFQGAGIIDSTAKNVLETVGNAQIDTTTKKFGTGSLEFDGTGDFISVKSPPSLLELGTGDFTIEFWINYDSLTSATGNEVWLVDFRPTTTNGVYPVIYTDSSNLYYSVNDTVRITGSFSFSTGTWYHIAVARSGTSTKAFVNGTQVGSTYTDSNNYLVGTNRPVFGVSGYNTSAYQLDGFIDEVRITKGVARYTANFTVPSKAFADQ